MKAVLFALAALVLAPAVTFADTRYGDARHGDNRRPVWESRYDRHGSGHSAPRATYRRYDDSHDRPVLRPVWPGLMARPFVHAPPPHHGRVHHTKSRSHH